MAAGQVSEAQQRTSAAHTMYVSLEVAWEVIVDDVREAGDVQPPSGHVRGYKHLHLPSFERIQRRGTLVLAALAMQARDFELRCGESCCECVDSLHGGRTLASDRGLECSTRHHACRTSEDVQQDVHPGCGSARLQGANHRASSSG